MPDLFDFLANNKDWIFSGIGISAVTGAAAVVRQFWMKRATAHPAKGMIGCYRAYIWALRRDGSILVCKANIHKNFFGIGATFDSFRFSFTGSVSISDSIYITLKGDEHKEILHIVLRRQLGPCNLMAGVYAAMTRTQKPAAGKIVFVREDYTMHSKTRPHFIAIGDAPATVKKLLNSEPNQALVVDDFDQIAISED